MSLVIDHNFISAWAFDELKTEKTAEIFKKLGNFQTKAIAPNYLLTELADLLAAKQKEGKITAAKARVFYDMLATFPIIYLEIDFSDAKEIQTIATENNISAFEAGYIHLAQTRKYSLASINPALTLAAEKLGIKLV